MYRRLPVPAGEHRFRARLADSAAGTFDYQSEATIQLPSGRALLIDFNAGQGGFLFRN